MDPNTRAFSSQSPSPEGDRSPRNNQVQETNDFSGEGKHSDDDMRPDLSKMKEESIFESYHQIRRELKRTLKEFENRNQVLCCELSRLRQEVELSTRKRDLRKTTLVELKTKAGKLDQAKQLAVKESFRDKRRGGNENFETHGKSNEMGKKPSMKNKTSVKEKYEYELQEKHNNMKLVDSEVASLKEKLHKYQQEMVGLKNLNVQLYDEWVKTHTSQSAETLLKQEKLELMEEFEFTTVQLKLQESKLHESIKEHKFLLGQIREAEKQNDTITAEIDSLSAQIDDLNKGGKDELDELAVFAVGHDQQMVSEFIKKKNAIREKLSEKNEVARVWAKKMNVSEEMWGNVSDENTKLKTSEDEGRKRNENLDRENIDFLAGMNEDKTSDKVKKLYHKLSVLLGEQIHRARQKLLTALNGIAELEEENAALDRELKAVCERDGKAEDYRGGGCELDELKRRIGVVRQEVKNLRGSIELGVGLEHLREEVRKVEQEFSSIFENERPVKIAQGEGTESSFRQTATLLEERTGQMKQVTDEELAQLQAKIDLFNGTISQLNRDIANVKNELVRSAEKNIAMTRDRIKLIRRLTETYGTLQTLSQSGAQDVTATRILGTIEEHLESSFRGMTQYLQMANFSSPSYSLYKLTLDAFETRFTALTASENSRLTDPVYLDDLKNAAFALFGLNCSAETEGASERVMSTQTTAQDFQVNE